MTWLRIANLIRSAVGLSPSFSSSLSAGIDGLDAVMELLADFLTSVARNEFQNLELAIR